jgi:hypothetical protein
MQLEESLERNPNQAITELRGAKQKKQQYFIMIMRAPQA